MKIASWYYCEDGEEDTHRRRSLDFNFRNAAADVLVLKCEQYWQYETELQEAYG